VPLVILIVLVSDHPVYIEVFRNGASAAAPAPPPPPRPVGR
jgi:hypothetical protein